MADSKQLPDQQAGSYTDQMVEQNTVATSPPVEDNSAPRRPNMYTGTDQLRKNYGPTKNTLTQAGSQISGQRFKAKSVSRKTRVPGHQIPAFGMTGGSHQPGYDQASAQSGARSSFSGQKNGLMQTGVYSGSQNQLHNNHGEIDLESEELTFQQARAIKIQVKKDCELLKNRVRMLQNEMNKARKKIETTTKRTIDIRQQQMANDLKFAERQRMQETRRQQQKPNLANMERRRKLNEEIKEKRFKMFLEKRKDVEETKKQRRQLMTLKEKYQRESDAENQVRRHAIREAHSQGAVKRMEFLEKKRLKAMRNKDGMVDGQRMEIYDAEAEAENLEALEAQLLQQLQETQQHEQMVFGDLRSALMDSTIPKKLRASQGTSQMVGSELGMSQTQPLGRGKSSGRH